MSKFAGLAVEELNIIHAGLTKVGQLARRRRWKARGTDSRAMQATRGRHIGQVVALVDEVYVAIHERIGVADGQRVPVEIAKARIADRAAFAAK